MLPKDPRHSSVFHVDAETSDFGLRATRMFLLFHLLHMNCEVCVAIHRSVSLFFCAEFNFRGSSFVWHLYINLLTPSVNYSGHTAPLSSKVAFYIFIQQIYILNILNMVYTLCLFSLQNAICFIILTYLVRVLFTFYIQGVLKFKKIILAPKGVMNSNEEICITY